MKVIEILSSLFLLVFIVDVVNTSRLNQRDIIETEDDSPPTDMDWDEYTRKSDKRTENFNLENFDDYDEYAFDKADSQIKQSSSIKRKLTKLNRTINNLQRQKKKERRLREKRKKSIIVEEETRIVKKKKKVRKRKKKLKRKLFDVGGLAGGGVKAEGTPQVNTSRIIVHSFAAPPKPDTNVIRAYDMEAHPQVIQARIRVPPRNLKDNVSVI